MTTIKHDNIGGLIFQCYKWLVVLPIFVLLTLFSGTVAVLLCVLVNPRMASRTIAPIWARLVAYISFMRVDVRGCEHIVPGQSYVIVANHQSLYDIIVVYGWLNIDFKWVMKQELRKVPCIGYACYKMGHIFLDRKDRAAAIATLQQAKTRLVNGVSVFFFPEGTRTETSDLKPFKKGAFKMAVELGLPLLPVTLIGTEKIMPARTMALYPGQVEMVIHPPITTTGMNDDKALEVLIEKTQQAISAPLSQTAG